MGRAAPSALKVGTAQGVPPLLFFSLLFSIPFLLSLFPVTSDTFFTLEVNPATESVIVCGSTTVSNPGEMRFDAFSLKICHLVATVLMMFPGTD